MCTSSFGSIHALVLAGQGREKPFPLGSTTSISHCKSLQFIMMTKPTYITKVKPLTGADNYKSWCSQVIDILIEGDLDEYVTGDQYTVPLDPSLIADWKKKSKKALASIRLHVADGPRAFIKDCTIASDAWDILKCIYEPKGALVQVQAQRKLLHAQCEEGEDVIEHLTKMKEMYNDVLNIDDSFSQEEFCNCIVTSLPTSMDNLLVPLTKSQWKILRSWLPKSSYMCRRNEPNPVQKVKQWLFMLLNHTIVMKSISARDALIVVMQDTN
jgi:hypothetical protein